MAQSRLFFSADKAEAERTYNILEQAFEDDGFPIAIIEIDEDRQIFEVSVYVEDDAEEVAARVDALVGPGLFDTEELPDIDWVTHSLEGLKPVRAGHFLVHGSHDRDK
ncbi:50S ribosomal protein L11 methyltransferase, partial [Brucella melitensis]|uniref:50S ribosomal protein L11 methyltransferase n=1 Tax=Brucella melitensis TaxID=29459 RepID=UPI0031FDE59C